MGHSFSPDGSEDQLAQAKAALESVALPYFEENKEDHESGPVLLR